MFGIGKKKEEVTPALGAEGQAAFSGTEENNSRRWMILGLAIAYAVSMSVFSIIQHRGFKTQMNDLGNADQAIWFAAHGDLSMPQSNTDYEQKVVSRFSVHVNPIFWIIAILYAVWPNPELLLVLTSLACAAAGLGLYAFALRRLGNTWWVVVPPIAFWISPFVHDANLYDFHVVTLGAAFLVWCVWAFDARRPGLALLLLLLTMMCKETVALAAVLLGCYLLISGRRREGCLVILVGCLYLYVILKIVTPILGAPYGLESLKGPDYRYNWVGGTSAEKIFQTLVGEPGKVLKHITQPFLLRLPIFLLIAGAGAALPAWPMLLLTLPDLIGGIFSSHPWSTRLTGTYYWIICFAVIVMACILTAEKKLRAASKRWNGALKYLGGMTLVLSILFSPLPYGLWSWPENYALDPAGRKNFEAVRKLIPADASICVQNNLGAHLSQRRFIAAYPRRLNDSAYALFYLRYVGGPDSGLFPRTLEKMLFKANPARIADEVENLVSSPDWGLVAQKDGFYLFARNQPSVFDRDVMGKQAAEDKDKLLSSYYGVSRRPFRWAKYCAGAFSWGHLADDFWKSVHALTGK